MGNNKVKIPEGFVLEKPVFQQWYAEHAKKWGLNPNPDDPQHFYDYRAAFQAGVEPDETGHWPSEFKLPGHPREVIEGVNTRTGQPAIPEGFALEEIPKTIYAQPVPLEDQIEAETLERELRRQPVRVDLRGPQFPGGTPRDLGPSEPLVRYQRQLEERRRKIQEEEALELFYTTYPEKRPRKYKHFVDELLRNTGGGALNVASGLTGTLASVSGASIFDPEQLEGWAQKLHQKSKEPTFTPAKGGGWRGFVAASVGQAAPYMAAAVGATMLTGTPMAAFGVGYSVEGDNAYRTAIELGATEEEAQMRKFLVGTINASIEALQVSQVMKFAKAGRGSAKGIMKAASDRAWKRVLAKGGKVGYEAAKHSAAEALEEVLQETTQIASEAKYNPKVWDEATQRILMAGLGGGTVGLLLGGGGRVMTNMRAKAEAGKMTPQQLEVMNQTKNEYDAIVAEGGIGSKQKAQEVIQRGQGKLAALEGEETAAAFEAEVAEMDREVREIQRPAAEVAKVTPEPPSKAITPEIPPTVPAPVGKPLEHPLAQGKTHQEIANMPIKEYADTIHNPADNRLQEIERKLGELRAEGGDYAKTDEWKQLKKEQGQLIRLTGGHGLPQAGMTMHERVAEAEAKAKQAPTPAKPKVAYRAGDLEAKVSTPPDLEGIYFADHKEMAKAYTELEGATAKEVKQYKIELKNPATEEIENQVARELGVPSGAADVEGLVTPYGLPLYDEQSAVKVAQELKKRGYDGVIRSNGEIVVFDKSSITPTPAKPPTEPTVESDYVYHSAFQKNFESIVKSGLKPKDGKPLFFAQDIKSGLGWGNEGDPLFRVAKSDISQLEKVGLGNFASKKKINPNLIEVSLDKGKTWQPLAAPTPAKPPVEKKPEPELTKKEIRQREIEAETEEAGISPRRRNRLIKETEKRIAESDIYQAEAAGLETAGREIDVGFYYVPKKFRAEVEDIIGERKGFPTKLQKMFTFDPGEGALDWTKAVQEGLGRGKTGIDEAAGAMDITEFVQRVKEALEGGEKVGGLDKVALDRATESGDPYLQYLITKQDMLQEGRTVTEIDEMTKEWAEHYGLDEAEIENEFLGAEPLKLKEIKKLPEAEQETAIEALARENVLKQERQEAKQAVNEVLKANDIEVEVEEVAEIEPRKIQRDLLGKPVFAPATVGKTKELGIEKGEISEVDVPIKHELAQEIARQLNKPYAPTELKDVAAAVMEIKDWKQLFHNSSNPLPEVRTALRDAIEGQQIPFERRGKPVGAAVITPAGREIVQLAYGADSTTGYHEGYHILRSHLTPKDRKVLDMRFKGDTEAEAREFAEFAKTGKATGYLRGIWRKLVEKLRKIKSALQGRGYRTAQDIFGEIQKGVVAKEGAAPGATQFERGVFGQPIQEQLRLPLPERQAAFKRVAVQEAREKIAKRKAKPTKEALPEGVKDKGQWKLTLDEYVAKYGKKGQDIGVQRAFFGLNHRKWIQWALKQGKPIPRNVLEEYKSEKWAQEALPKPAPITEEPRTYNTKTGKIVESPLRLYGDGKDLTLAELHKMSPEEVISVKRYSARRGGVARGKIKVGNLILPEITTKPYEEWRPKGVVPIKTKLIKAVDQIIGRNTKKNVVKITPEQIADKLAFGPDDLFYKPSFGGRLAEITEAFNQLVKGGPLIQFETSGDRMIRESMRNARIKAEKARLKTRVKPKVSRARLKIKLRDVTPQLSREMGQEPGAMPKRKPERGKVKADITATPKFAKEFEPDVTLDELVAEPRDTKPKQKIYLTDKWFQENIKPHRKKAAMKPTSMASRSLKLLDKVLGSSSTRLGNIHPELKRQTRRYAFDVMTRSTNMIDEVEPFLKAMRKMSKDDYKMFDLALKNGYERKITELVGKYGLEKEYSVVRDVLDDLYNAAKEVGIDMEYRKDYWHRHLKDPEGFLEYFQKGDDWSIIEEAIKRRAERAGRTIEELTDEEKAQVVNTLLRGYRIEALTLARPGAAKARTVEVIDADLNQFYDDSASAMVKYVRLMNRKIAEREFFGRETKEITNLRKLQSSRLTRLLKLQRRRGLKEGTAEGKYKEHISQTAENWKAGQERLQRLTNASPENTIGGYVMDLQRTGQIKPSQEKELRDILQGIFYPRGMSRGMGFFATGVYIDTLNSPLQALTQLDEFAYSFYRSPTKSVPVAIRTALRRSKITPKDIGITSIGVEFQGPSMQRALTTMLKATGFEQIDRLNKENYINTALAKMQAQAKGKESAPLIKRLVRVFGKDYKNVLEDLRKPIKSIEDVSDDVKYLLFNELLDIQPVAITEMPEAYNKAGNMRILYALKTFYMKRLDFIRNECWQDMKSPKTFARGFGKLAWLALSFALFGAGSDALKDFIRGRKFNLKDSIYDNMLKMVFFSKYQVYKTKTEGGGRAVLESWTPPTKAIDAVSKDVVNVAKGKDRGFEIWRSVPLGGELYYWWFGRGREKIEAQEGKGWSEATE